MPGGRKAPLDDSVGYTIATDTTGGGQKGWRRCHKCQGMWYGLEKLPKKCPAGDEHASEESDAYQLVRVTKRIVIHTKVLTEPEIPIDKMMQRMREVFGQADLDIELRPREDLDLPKAR
jgi:hypothetical protein